MIFTLPNGLQNCKQAELMASTVSAQMITPMYPTIRIFL